MYRSAHTGAAPTVPRWLRKFEALVAQVFYSILLTRHCGRRRKLRRFGIALAGWIAVVIALYLVIGFVDRSL